MPLAALYTGPLGARPLALPPSTLRGPLGGATMTTPGGAGTRRLNVQLQPPVLGASASIMGSELSVYWAPAFILSVAALFRLSHHPIWRGLSFALLCVARDLGWCDHGYPRWGEHTLCNGHLECPPVLGSPARS